MKNGFCLKLLTCDEAWLREHSISEVREDAIVKNLLHDGAFTFIVLGGGHDLSDNIERLSGGTCEYLTIETSKYQELSERECEASVRIIGSGGLWLFGTGVVWYRSQGAFGSSEITRIFSATGSIIS